MISKLEKKLKLKKNKNKLQREKSRDRLNLIKNQLQDDIVVIEKQSRMERTQKQVTNI